MIFVKKIGHLNKTISLAIGIILSLSSQVDGQSQRELLQRRDPRVFTHYEIVDSEGAYEVEWVANWEQRRIFFEVTVQTRGYVVFGFAKEQRIEGADIIIGGVVGRNGSSYFTDRNGVRSGAEPLIDPSQDWQLHEAEETGGQTFLRFSRAFDTCNDGEDIQINEYDTIYIVWSYGESDNPSQEWRQNSPDRIGFYPVNLLDPNLIPRPIKEASFRRGPPPRSILAAENLQVWTVTTRTRLPSTDTAYMCTMHQAPRLRRKHHLIGFNTRLETQEAYSAVHHLLFYRCVPPENTTAAQFFSRYVDLPEEMCFFLARPTGKIPTQYCTRVTVGYAIGTRIQFFPDHVGIPFGQEMDEFYVLQVHYDNPERTNLQVEVNLDIYYTSDHRESDLGVITVGHHIPGSPSILIPPQTPAHNIYGHCSPECTDSIIPPEGINIILSVLHTHYAGRKVHARHVRGNQELEWIMEDSNYDPTSQQFRLLRDERNVRPGDHLMMDCEFDSTEANGTVVGGFSTRQEMCLTYYFYYNVLEDYSLCRSEIVDEEYRRKYLGVNNLTWSEEKLDFVATSPRNIAGLSMAEISDTRVRWTNSLRSELQFDHRNFPQLSACSASPFSSTGQGQVAGGDEITGTVSFPNGITEYSPPERQCSNNVQVTNREANLLHQVGGRGTARRPSTQRVNQKQDFLRGSGGWGWNRF